MPSVYDYFELRLEVCGPVASESPFDSGTLWGRILCALKSGSVEEQDLADGWLNELREKTNASPPLVISEGFQCDAGGEPWLPLPQSIALSLQLPASLAERKKLKEIDRIPMKTFARICAESRINPKELVEEVAEFQKRKPVVSSMLQPHLGMDRLSGSGRDRLLYMTSVSVYSALKQEAPEHAFHDHTLDSTLNTAKPEIVFYLKLRQQEGTADLVRNTLRKISLDGWGHGKARGLGRIWLVKNLDPWEPPPAAQGATGFVSLSHFCPAASDPTQGQWKLHAKHPVPAPFVDGKRVTLGEEGTWRVKSFLRLRAGSCLFFKSGQSMNEYYGRTLRNLLDPAEDHEGNKLPDLYHYAISYPWPLRVTP
jgi:hypothetical protein